MVPVFTSRPVGFVRSPYSETKQIPKGLGAKHEAEGTLEILPEFEPGLADIEGFSHLFVLWEFDRSTDFDLVASPPCDDRSHGVFATRSPRRPNPIGLTVVQLVRRDGRALHVFVEHCVGSLERPLDDAGLERKFHGLVDPVLGAQQADALIKSCATLGDCANLAELTALTTPRRPSALRRGGAT